MHNYLSKHPEIFMSNVKEPNFFARDFHPDSPRWSALEEMQYLALFNKAGNAKRVGESSTSYLYSKSAANEIRTYVQDSRIIAILRHPVDAMYSLHGHYLFSGHEHIIDFFDAVQAEGQRRRAPLIGDSNVFRQAMFYREIFRYPPQLRRYFDAFGRDRVKVVIFDDLIHNTANVYRETLDFLGVNSNYQINHSILKS